jgi:hypothetical protein
MSAAGWERTRLPSTPWLVRGEARSAPPCINTNKKSERLVAKNPTPQKSKPLISKRRRRAYSSSRPRWMAPARPARPSLRLLTSPPRALLRHAPAPPRPAPLLLLIAWRRAPLRPPQVMPALPPELPPATGVKAPNYQRDPAPRLLPPHPPPRTSTPRSPGRRAPAARAAGTPRSATRGARGIALRAPSCAPPAPALVAAPPDQARGSQEWAERISRRSGSPSASEDVKGASETQSIIKIKNGAKEYALPAGRWRASRGPTGTGRCAASGCRRCSAPV